MINDKEAQALIEALDQAKADINAVKADLAGTVYASLLERARVNIGDAQVTLRLGSVTA